MKSFLRHISNVELGPYALRYAQAVLGLVVFVAVGYPMVEVYYTMYPDFSLSHFLDVVNNPANMPLGHEALKPIFPILWLGLATTCIAFRCYIIISSYFLGIRRFGKERFLKNFAAQFPATVIGLVATLAALALFGAIAYGLGYPYDDGANVFANAIKALRTWVNTHIPTLLPIQNYWLALLVIFVTASLPNYVVHWLCHTSRIMWYVLHRPHHAPEILHPLAAPPAYMFDFVLLIPSGITTIVISKIFYTEALVLEGSLMFLLRYFLEIFNHSSAHYEWAHRNIIIRNLSRLVGDSGVYHLVHHSSAKEDQMVNLSGGPFNLWDRLFGTYKQPPAAYPAMGLTDNPPISHNPLRILFSGILHIAYEFKMNKGFKDRFYILFGSVYYKPPVSRDFLIRSPSR